MYLSEGHLVVKQGDSESRSWENSPTRVGMRDVVKRQRVCSARRASVGETTMLPAFSGAPKWQKGFIIPADIWIQPQWKQRLLPKTW